jgi:prepilin-type N-terminal cleavage/methylation domain-containing protein
MQKKAFTLIELIVALAIMGILSSLIAPSFFEYQRTKNLDLAAQLLETALSESFSASRSTPHIFGVKGVVATSQIKTFSCSYPEKCTDTKFF